MRDDLERFYALLARVEEQPGQGRRLADLAGHSAWPARGIYFFREAGESRADRPGVSRVVRVGTHAVSSNARSTLWGRLRTHRGGRAGGGNHPSSLFPLPVGLAVLPRGRAELSPRGVGPPPPEPVP